MYYNNFTYRNHAIDFFVYENLEFDIIESGVIDYVGGCENLGKMRGISDHLPVFVLVGF